MSRLIDADDLIIEILTHDLIGDDKEVDKIILDAPTVEAIPVEFIKKLIEEFDCERGNAIKDTFAHILTGLLEFWEFEKEKENEID